jgi:hypothetical protein
VRHAQVYSNFYFTERQFAYIMAALLARQRIPAEVIVSTPNNLTRLKDLLFEDELSWCLRVNNKFLFRPGEHNNPYDLQENLLENEAYKLPANSRDSTVRLQLPGTKAEENSSKYMITAGIDATFNHINVERTTEHRGLQKQQYSEEALRFIPYMFEDYKVYYGDDDMNLLPERYQDEYYEKRKALKEEFARLKPDYMKKQAQDDFGSPVQYRQFELVSDGRSHKKTELVVKEKFSVADKIRKAGKKYLVNVAGLMGGQLQIKKDEQTRSFDIDVRRPRSLYWQIKFTVPAGYTVGGVENLHTTVDNETGAFKSTAKLEGNLLTIEVTKTYKQRHITKDRWPDMLAFVDAAYNFGHRLILLKPAN